MWNEGELERILFPINPHNLRYPCSIFGALIKRIRQIIAELECKRRKINPRLKSLPANKVGSRSTKLDINVLED